MLILESFEIALSDSKTIEDVMRAYEGYVDDLNNDPTFDSLNNDTKNYFKQAMLYNAIERINVLLVAGIDDIGENGRIVPLVLRSLNEDVLYENGLLLTQRYILNKLCARILCALQIADIEEFVEKFLRQNAIGFNEEVVASISLQLKASTGKAHIQKPGTKIEG